MWVKIEERFTKSSHAFRFFDQQWRSKISFKEFERGIERLKIKFHTDEMRKIFEYLDDDKDKFLNYNKFSKLNKNSQVTSRLPENKLLPHGLSATNYNMFPRAKSNDIWEDKNKEGSFKFLIL